MLQWLNTLGGWDYWNFTAFKTYGEEVRNVQTIKRDIFEDWDSDFKTGKTESEHLSLEVAETIQVRSQNLTIQQVDAIKNIRTAIKVVDSVLGRTVIVDKGSFQYRTDNEKNNSIEFRVTYPGTIVQKL